MPDSSLLYTIGHSDHTVEQFIALLRGHGITAVIDVRSQPYSRWVPQFNQKPFRQALEEAGLTYLFMGDSLGGRPDDPALQDAQGHADYEQMGVAPAFQEGLARLRTLVDTEPAVIMCSEGDYHGCHRSLLIAPHLLRAGVRIMHILPDGQVEEAHEKPRQLCLF